MRQGFMLIELIIASLIASMVAAILLAALAQSNRFQTVVDNLVNNSVRVAVVSHQLEKDLMGAFICTQSLDTSPAGTLGMSGGEKKEEQTSEKKGAESTPKKVLGKIFYSTNKNGQFDTLTFITNNPLVVYVGKDVGVVKPKAVRVQYTLKPEEEKKDSYALFRQESMELDLDLYKNVTAYEMISGIKSCTMTFTARIEKKPAAAPPSHEASEGSRKASSKVEYEYKVLNEWVSEQKKEKKETEKEEFPRIPYSVEIKMILWDLQEKREKEFTIVCQIPTDFSEPKEEDKQAERPQQQEDKNEAGNDKNKTPQPNASAHNQINGKEHIIVVSDGSQNIVPSIRNKTRFFGRT